MPLYRYDEKYVIIVTEYGQGPRTGRQQLAQSLAASPPPSNSQEESISYSGV